MSSYSARLLAVRGRLLRPWRAPEVPVAWPAAVSERVAVFARAVLARVDAVFERVEAVLERVVAVSACAVVPRFCPAALRLAVVDCVPAVVGFAVADWLPAAAFAAQLPFTATLLLSLCHFPFSSKRPS